MKKFLFVLVISTTVFASNVFGQFTTYGIRDNTYSSAALGVEKLDSSEISVYNTLISNENNDPKLVLYVINALRAMVNLSNAPATIIDNHIMDEKLTEDPEAVNFAIELINSTTKTIKEISFEFDFYNFSNQVYDTKTGDQTCKLVFNSPLKGRPELQEINDVVNIINDCYHLLRINDANYKKLFHNKDANNIKLKKCFIKYTDGSTSDSVAIYDGIIFIGDNLINGGPLAPVLDYLKKTNMIK